MQIKSKLEYYLTFGCQNLFDNALMYVTANMDMPRALELHMPSAVNDFSGFYSIRFPNFTAIIFRAI